MRTLLPYLMIATALALFFLFVSPRWGSVKEFRSQMGQYNEALNKAAELRGLRDELLVQFNALPKDDITRLERLVPDSVNTVKLVTDIDAVAGKYGITVSNVRVTEETVDISQEVPSPETAKPYLTTTITFKFTATYQNLVAFLKDLEKSLQLVDVKSVSFDSGKSKNNLYEYEVAIQTYWLK
ncbi:hypothetical protein EPN83_00040 [Patescibacteria group bacterium]|nr:MAG: hypothetical protein EPN83_00040 [Patescibacteria group bacterium]